MSEHPGPGQPTKFEDDFCRQAEELCELGATDLKLAKFFQVVKSTIGNWKREHPEFFEAIRRGKDKYDSEVVEQSLLKAARGYKVTETTREARPVFRIIKNEDGTETQEQVGKELALTKRVRKHIAGDVIAQIFWLKNRTTRWKDIKDLRHLEPLKVEYVSPDDADDPD